MPWWTMGIMNGSIVGVGTSIHTEAFSMQQGTKRMNKQERCIVLCGLLIHRGAILPLSMKCCTDGCKTRGKEDESFYGVLARCDSATFYGLTSKDTKKNRKRSETMRRKRKKRKIPRDPQ